MNYYLIFLAILVVEVRRNRNLNFFDLLKLIQNQPVFIIVYLSEFDRVLCVCVCVFAKFFLSFQIQKPKYFQ